MQIRQHLRCSDARSRHPISKKEHQTQNEGSVQRGNLPRGNASQQDELTKSRSRGAIELKSMFKKLAHIPAARRVMTTD